MKKQVLAAAAAISLLFVSFGALAQEMSFRSGVVTGISPIQTQVQKSSSSSGGSSAMGGLFKRIAKRTMYRAALKSDSEYAADAYDVGSSAVDEAATASPSSSGQGQTVTAYMVMIKFDDGTESAIQSADASNLAVGSRIRVFGSGNSAKIVAQ